ncbi:hypothetical protein ACFYWS_39340 [Streptomyces sp. NPDC002795]|uniref:hypothetical protein n=1 Tax=Streptomyces sp. NPDC002795 TaxID=3364665 RepID=UPI0036CB1B8C
MQHPFKHPSATHHAMEVLGYRRNGSPIYAIAGGSGEGEGGSGSGGSEQSNQSGTGGDPSGGQSGDQGGQQSGQGSGASGSESGDGTDWKSEARKWEKRAKDNNTELETLRTQNMSEQEKAVAEAEKKGRTAAAADYGTKLANAEFRAAVAAAGIDLGEAADLIDVNRFVGDDGEVNVQAIKSAVTKLSKLAPRGPGRSGTDMGSGGSGDQAASLDKQIEEASKRRDFATVIRLKRQKAAQTT